MALDVGAATCGDFGSFHAEPLDPRSGAPEPIILVFNYGILVNAEGKRFVDEAPATVDATYEAITRVVFEQPGGIAYVILNFRIDDVPGWQRSVRTDQPPIRRMSIAELAEKIGIDPASLERTVAAYNRACPEESAFRPLVLDGLATDPELHLRKSNWSRELKKAPYLAWPIICGNCFTFGGLRINAKGQVLNSNGVAIPGLYAAGEAAGLYYGRYTGATSVLRGAVFRPAGGRACSRQEFFARPVANVSALSGRLLCIDDGPTPTIEATGQNDELTTGLRAGADIEPDDPDGRSGRRQGHISVLHQDRNVRSSHRPGGVCRQGRVWRRGRLPRHQ